MDNSKNEDLKASGDRELYYLTYQNNGLEGFSKPSLIDKKELDKITYKEYKKTKIQEISDLYEKLENYLKIKANKKNYAMSELLQYLLVLVKEKQEMRKLIQKKLPAFVTNIIFMINSDEFENKDFMDLENLLKTTTLSKDELEYLKNYIENRILAHPDFEESKIYNVIELLTTPLWSSIMITRWPKYKFLLYHQIRSFQFAKRKRVYSHKFNITLRSAPVQHRKNLSYVLRRTKIVKHLILDVSKTMNFEFHRGYLILYSRCIAKNLKTLDLIIQHYRGDLFFLEINQLMKYTTNLDKLSIFTRLTRTPNIQNFHQARFVKNLKYLKSLKNFYLNYYTLSPIILERILKKISILPKIESIGLAIQIDGQVPFGYFQGLIHLLKIADKIKTFLIGSYHREFGVKDISNLVANAKNLTNLTIVSRISVKDTSIPPVINDMVSSLKKLKNLQRLELGLRSDMLKLDSTLCENLCLLPHFYSLKLRLYDKDGTTNFDFLGGIKLLCNLTEFEFDFEEAYIHINDFTKLMKNISQITKLQYFGLRWGSKTFHCNADHLEIISDSIGKCKMLTKLKLWLAQLASNVKNNHLAEIFYSLKKLKYLEELSLSIVGLYFEKENMNFFYEIPIRKLTLHFYPISQDKLVNELKLLSDTLEELELYLLEPFSSEDFLSKNLLDYMEKLEKLTLYIEASQNNYDLVLSKKRNFLFRVRKFYWDEGVLPLIIYKQRVN